MPIGRVSSLLAMAGAVLTLTAASCDKTTTEPNDTPKATRTNLVVYATYSGAQLSVYVNDQLVGNLSGTWTGSTACGTMLSAPPSSVVTISAFVGQTYRLKAVAPNGRGISWNPVTVDAEMVEEAICYGFRIQAAP